MKMAALLCALLVALACSTTMTMASDAQRSLRSTLSAHYPRLSASQIKEFAQLIERSSSTSSSSSSSDQLHQRREEHHSQFARSHAPASAFNCTVYPPTRRFRPRSSKFVRPADVKVIGAFGDSIIAGFGAKATSLDDLFDEHRSVSFAVGGDSDFDQVVTLGTILRQYNPHLAGLTNCAGSVHAHNLNMAVTGATIQDLAGQVHAFIDRLKASVTESQFNEDWKMVSIMIGQNNLCHACLGQSADAPSTYGRLLEESIDILYAQVPRVFINLIIPSDVTIIRAVAGFGLCGLIQPYGCACLGGGDAALAALTAAHEAYVQEMERIVSLPKYEHRRDMALVLQPFLRDAKVPKLPNGQPDISYFAPDCIHFSEKAHRAAAVGLWNNLISPSCGKATDLYPGDKIKCPKKRSTLPLN